MWRSANLIIMNMMLLMLLIIMTMMLNMMIDNHDDRGVYDDKLVLALLHISLLLSLGELNYKGSL